MSIFIHVSVAIRDRDRVLLVQEGRDDNEHYGCWNLPGGRLEPGETLPDGAVREVIEETGLRVTLHGLVGIYTDRRDPLKHAIRFVYSAPNPGGRPVPGEEILSVRWFSENDLSRLPDQDLINPYLLRRVVANFTELPCFPLDMIDEPDSSLYQIKP